MVALHGQIGLSEALSAVHKLCAERPTDKPIRPCILLAVALV